MKLEQVHVDVDAKIAPYKKAMAEMKRTTERATKPAKEAINSVGNEVQKSTNKIGGIMATLGKYLAVGAIVAGMGRIAKQSTQTALEVSASINQIKRIMGESSQSFLKWSQNSALAFNMSKGDALKYGAVYSNLFSNFIQDTDQLSGYTVKMLKASSIIASATGRSMDDVMERIRSGMLGSTEAIEDLGINVNVAMLESTQAFQQFANGRSWDQLDFQTQQAIRMMAILEQTNKKFGDSLMQGPTNSVAQFSALLKNISLNIGNALLPILEAIMPVLNSFALAVNKATQQLATFMQLLFGKKAKAENPVKDTANSMKGVGDGLNNAGDGAEKLDKGLGKSKKKAKELKKEISGLMGFDEINILGGGKDKNPDFDDESETDKNTGGVNLPKVSFDDGDSKENINGLLSMIDKLKMALQYLKDLLDKVRSGFMDTFKVDGLEKLKQSIEGIANSIYDIFSDSGVHSAVDSWAKTWAYSLGQVTGSIGNAIVGVAYFVAESFNKSLKETSPHIKQWIIDNLQINEDIGRAVGNIAKGIGDTFHDVITSEPATNIGADIISMFTIAFTDATTIVHGLVRDVFVGVETIVTENKEKLTGALTGTLEAVEPIFETFKTATKDLFEGLKGLYDEHLKPLIDDIFKGISDLVGMIIDAYTTHILPIIEEFSAKFQESYDTYIKPAMDALFEALGKLLDALRMLWNEVLVPLFAWLIENIMPVLEPIIKFLGDVVLLAIKTIGETIESISKILSGLIDFITGVFTGDWELAWNGIKGIVSGVLDLIKSLFDNFWALVKLIFSTALNTIKNIVDTQFKAIKTVAETIWNGIKSFIKSIWDSITKTIGDALRSIGTAVSEKFNEIKNKTTDAFNSVKTTISNALNNALTTVRNLVTNMYNAVKDWFGKIPNTIRESWNNAVNFLKNIDLFEIGRNIIRGLIDGIRDMARNLWDTVQGIGEDVDRAVRNALGINSPSRVMMEVGGFVGEGLTLGISKEAQSVVNSAKNMGQNVIDGFGQNDFNLSKTLNVNAVGSVSNNLVESLASLITNNKTVSDGGNIIIQIGDKEFGRFAIKKINEEQERAGTTLLRV